MATKPKAGDVTGRQRQALLKEHAEELSKRAEEMSVATAVEAARLETEVVDMTTPARPTTIIDEVESVGVDLADNTEVVRVAEDIEQMTLGAGNHYSFKAGQKYKVSKAVASHLREKGFLYDRA